MGCACTHFFQALMALGKASSCKKLSECVPRRKRNMCSSTMSRAHSQMMRRRLFGLSSGALHCGSRSSLVASPSPPRRRKPPYRARWQHRRWVSSARSIMCGWAVSCRKQFGQEVERWQVCHLGVLRVFLRLACRRAQPGPWQLSPGRWSWPWQQSTGRRGRVFFVLQDAQHLYSEHLACPIAGRHTDCSIRHNTFVTNGGWSVISRVLLL